MTFADGTYTWRSPIFAKPHLHKHELKRKNSSSLQKRSFDSMDIRNKQAVQISGVVSIADNSSLSSYNYYYENCESNPSRRGILKTSKFSHFRNAVDSESNSSIHGRPADTGNSFH